MRILPLLFLLCAAAALATPPKTDVEPAVDVYHGVQVTDPYRWLENSTDPRVLAWTHAQDDYARAWLRRVPGADAIKRKLMRWFSAEGPSYLDARYVRGRWFVLRTAPPRSQPLLVVQKSPDDVAHARVLLDPNKLDPSGTTAIDFWVPSLDGRHVAVSLSKGGSEDGTLHFYETDSGRELPDRIAHVQKPTAGGSVAWSADGVYYTRYPAEGERPAADLDFYQQVWFHRLGSTDDRYCIGKDFPRIAEIELQASDDGKYVLAQVANGDGGEYEHFLLKNGKWLRLSKFSDRWIHAGFGTRDDLYVLSRHGAPRGKLLRLPLSTLKPAIVVPQGDAVIEAFCATENDLYVLDLVGGPSRLRRFPVDGRRHGEGSLRNASDMRLPPISAVSPDLVRGPRGQMLFRVNTYLDPPAWYLASGGLVARRTAMASTSPVNFRDCEVVRQFATSRDGTKVPLNVIRKKKMRFDGNNPVLLTGYGGYGVSRTPRFSPHVRLWLDRGGVYVVANLRGGGEYGDAWHEQGKLTRKQNVFDDFVAAARFLIAQKYTSPRRLAIEGGSNGGLLMGAALTQHPELFRAVVSHVGIYDMLRVELDPNGAFNTTEFGTVKDRAQFKALYAYSPYHHVVRGARYPALLLTTGANDGRVNPAQSKKMAAIMQASGSANPVLLRVAFSAGHGVGTGLAERVAQQADVYAFLFQQLGMVE